MFCNACKTPITETKWTKKKDGTTRLFIRHALRGTGGGRLIPDCGVVPHPGSADGVQRGAGAELGQVYAAVEQLYDVCIFKKSLKTCFEEVLAWLIFSAE